MSWVNDLASSLGIPAGAATLAAAMYAACAAAEKAARPEALQDIGRILKDPSWEQSVRPSAVVERIFIWTFGDRYLSRKSILVSMFATFIFVSSISLFVWEFTRRSSFGAIPLLGIPGFLAANIMFFGLVPDFISVSKTRMLLQTLGDTKSQSNIIWAASTDLFVSALISLIYNTVVLSSLDGTTLTFSFRTLIDTLRFTFGVALPSITYPPIMGAIFCSTLLTSVWTILILLSTTVIKLIAPVQRFTAWFFDVDKHPVQAIGIVAGALVMIGGGVWSLLLAVF
jgi:hypothetical protein